MAKIGLVFQTHWDREWYYSVDTFNFRLLRVMNRILELLDKKEIFTFVLDGQVKVIEDYFKICSDKNKEKTLNYLKENRIIVGPWYVLADEFLVEGESLIRNLERGILKAQNWGGYQKLGYLPDTFGHVSQMPQIFKHFNIHQALIWRGVNIDEPWFNWLGADGQEVQTIFLKTGYYQPIIDQDNAIDQLETWISKQPDPPHHGALLLTNGGDHLMPSQISIGARLKTIEKKTKHSFTLESYESYIHKYLKNPPTKTFQGELRNNENAYLLPNVLSTRYPLKYTNKILENRLTMQIEPLIALAHVSEIYPHQNYLDEAWRLLLENHPHDSICGCSIDTVHREMQTRSQKLTDQCQAIEQDLVVELGLSQATNNNLQGSSNIFSDDTVFTVYNPTPYQRHGYQKVVIFLDNSNALIDSFRVKDFQGKTEYTTIILSKKPDRIFASPLDSMPKFRQGFTYEILFKVNHLEGFGLRTYTLVKGPQEMLIKSDDRFIENDQYRLEFNQSGDLNLLDKTNQKMHKKLHQLYSSLDAGDEYNYSQPLKDIISMAQLKKVHTCKHQRIQMLNCEYEINLPSSLNSERESGSSQLVTNRIEVTFELIHGSTSVNTHMRYINHACDQRTRVHFPSPTISYHYSDTAFDLVKRSVRVEKYEADKGKEVPPVVDPSSSLIKTSEGFDFVHIGLHEYQVSDAGLDVTLLRSVGSLSRDDLRSRGGGAGPSFETPDAQLIGMHEYFYQWSTQGTVTLGQSLIFKNPLRVFKGALQSPRYLIEIDNQNVVASSVRQKSLGLEIRVYNPTEEVQSFTLKTEQAIASVKAVNGFLEPRAEEALFDLPPKVIRTYHILWQPHKTIQTDVLIAGGSIGGCIAAKTLLAENHRVLLTESTRWIGGQLTNQGVPLDEHPFIESFGATASYHAFRHSIRETYKKKFKLTSSDRLNPGNAWVTRLAFEPRVAHLYFEELLIHKALDLRLKTQVISASYDDEKVYELTLKDLITGHYQRVKAKYFLDATDTGELLPLTGTSYVVGAESQAITGEPHAKNHANPQDMQPITHVAALRWDEGATEPIQKPSLYETFKNIKTPYANHSILSPYGPDSSTGKSRAFNLISPPAPLWSYRRIFDPKTLNCEKKSERSLLNWPQNDYFMGNIIDDENASEHLDLAKELTRCLIYYIQTEYPHEKGQGFPQIQIDTDCLGTDDGFAMAPYIRESRRIQAIKTIVEQDVSAKTQSTLPKVENSVGIGCYHIDLHITTQSHTFFYDHTWPFEIPIEALIPVTKTNLLPACKNIGTTHLTNGCFRLHPVEWNIGETVGHLVNYCLLHKINPHELRVSKKHLRAFKQRLDAFGIQRHWPEKLVHVI